MNYGETSYGETYAQALDATDYSYQTLMDSKWISGRIKFSRRRENLSFSHHKEVAALDPEEQTFWLQRAEDEGWTRNELRRAIKEQSTLEPVAPRWSW